MRKLALILFGVVSTAILMAFGGGDTSVHSTGGAPAGVAGDPSGGNKTCNTPGCHTGATVGTLSGVFSSNIPPSGYIPGSTYTITAAFLRPGHSKYGFEATPQNASGTKLGTLANISGTTLVGSGKYITHISSSTAGSGSKTWNFRWTAPAVGTGNVTFYGAFNATNSNGSDTGDSIFKSTMVVTENPTGINDLKDESFAVSTFPNPAHNELNVEFSLSESKEVSIDLFDVHGRRSGQLLEQTQLAGQVSRTFDISGYETGVYFVLINTGDHVTSRRIIKL